MTRWIALVVFSAVAQTMMFGCCAFAPKNPCLEQEQANAALQARNKALEASLQQKDGDLSRLQADLAARDAKIAASRTFFPARAGTTATAVGALCVTVFPATFTVTSSAWG